MSELKFFKIGFIVMVLLNLVFLFLAMGFFYRTSLLYNGLDPFQNKIIKELQLDTEQTNEFMRLASEHHTQIEEKLNQQKANLQDYFSPLHGNTLTPPNDSIIIAIETVEREKIELTYQHLRDLKSLLSFQQQQHFSPILSEALELILGQKKIEKD